MQVTEEDILLFRFHKHPELCKQRITKLTEEIGCSAKVYAIGENIFTETEEERLFEDVYYPPHSDRDCWLHGDLAVRDWFLAKGKSLDFRNLILLEWDVLLKESIQRILPNETTGIFLCNYKPLSKQQYTWLSGRNDEIQFLETHFEKEFQTCIEPPINLGFLPLSVFPREFLKKYSTISVPTVGNDEIRISLASQASKYPVHSITLSNKTFNVENNPVIVDEEDEAKLYHPVKTKL